MLVEYIFDFYSLQIIDRRNNKKIYIFIHEESNRNLFLGIIKIKFVIYTNGLKDVTKLIL